MSPTTTLDRIAAALLVLLIVLTAMVEWGVSGVEMTRAVVAAAILLLLVPRVQWSRRAFVAVGLALTVWNTVTTEAWAEVALRGLSSAGFIGAFFAALATLRSVAQTSPAMAAAGRYLASQPPGWRYVALSIGGHLFALPLSYGAISLLGSLATSAAETEPDPVIRNHRRRRMLLAIQRGFITTLPWSPMAFAMAITTVLIPGASWREAVLPGLVTAAILFSTGWAVDTVFKPRLTASAPKRAVEGSRLRLSPLFVLLAMLAMLTAGLHTATGVRIVGVVLVVVPLISFCWAALPTVGEPGLGQRVRTYLFTDLPGYRGEIVLLMMAGYIGTVGAPLLAPIVGGLGLDLAAAPPAVLLVGLVWLVPVLGQLGMNPILAITLIAPIIPTPESIGVSPSAVVTAIVAGWSISGICSPFTATTLITGSFGKVSALHVGLRWNGGYVLAVGVLLSLWVLLFAALSGGA